MEDYERSGKTFIAYKGSEFNQTEIVRCLEAICPTQYKVKTIVRNQSNLVMAKIVYNSYKEDRDPYFLSNRTIAVSGYCQSEIEKTIKASEFSIDDPDKYHLLINALYVEKELNLFKTLNEYMHFCTVIWDEPKQKLIAGVTIPKSNNRNTHLYYGFTKKNKEVIFSNDQNILYNFCDEVKEMQANTYMVDDIIYNFNGDVLEELKKNKSNNLIKKTRENADNLLEGLNAVLLSITSEAVREKIEENINDYLESDNPKKKLTDYIVKELDSATQKEVLTIIQKTINEYNIEQNIEQKLKNIFDDILTDYTKSINVPISYNVYLNNAKVGQTKGGFHHECFEDILKQTQLEEPIMMIGPAGSGKNVAVSQVADALGLKMYYTNNASNEFKLTGFIDAGGNYHETEFYRAFKNGGLFFLDEIDNSDPSALIVINSALANGYMAFPHETIDSHPDFRIITAANTWGKGADLQYVGRNALDAATLDRFDSIFFDYDRKLEECLYPNEDVLKFMWAFRESVLKSKIPHVVSTRGIGKVYKKEINGTPVNKTLTSNVVKGLNQDDVNSIIGNMNNINSNNKYYDGLKKLTLRR